MAPNVHPIYADEANVNANVKINIEKDEEGNEVVKKVGKIDILFMDQVTKSVINRVIIDPFTAKVLGKILIDNADKLLKEIDNREVPQEVKDQIKEREEMAKDGKAQPFNTYIG